MSDLITKYGLKEVSDVTFYSLNDDGEPDAPVMFLDTLKVSTIDTTGEQVTANGGKGNPILISWDTNKEITVTLEDALFSPRSMATAFGGTMTYAANTAQNPALGSDTTAGANLIMRTEVYVPTANITPSAGIASSAFTWVDVNGYSHVMKNPVFYSISSDGTSHIVSATDTLTKGTSYYVTYDVNGKDTVVTNIYSNSFGGTFYVVGDTYIRNAASGEDINYQWIVPKAKIQAENTLTMEADGDPATLNFTMTVMRPANGGAMMKFIQYDLADAGTPGTSTDKVIHNHTVAANALAGVTA